MISLWGTSSVGTASETGGSGDDVTRNCSPEVCFWGFMLGPLVVDIGIAPALPHAARLFPGGVGVLKLGPLQGTKKP